MKHSISTVLAAFLCSFLLAAGAPPLTVRAENTQIPHLIQTVTERDIYESLLALDLLKTPVLETGDCEKAYENVKNCVVRINMGNAYGSGVIWEMTPERIIIVTNKHVLEYWDDLSSYVYFPQGYFVEAEILELSEEYDIGFLSVDNLEFSYAELEQMRCAHWDMDAYRTLRTGDAMFCIGMEGENAAGAVDAFYQGSIGDMWQYIDEFGEYMIYGYGYAQPGMSGGGTFDTKGYLIGMLSGGTAGGETASVPLPLILEAYEEIQ